MTRCLADRRAQAEPLVCRRIKATCLIDRQREFAHTIAVLLQADRIEIVFRQPRLLAIVLAFGIVTVYTCRRR